MLRLNQPRRSIQLLGCVVRIMPWILRWSRIDHRFCQITRYNNSINTIATIGVDLAELLGGRMASAEGGSVPSGVEYGEGYPLFSRLRGLGSVVSSPSGVRGRAPAENGFWRIFKATERSFLYLHVYDKIWGDNLH